MSVTATTTPILDPHNGSCPRSDLPPAWCAHCRGDQLDVPAELTDTIVTHTFRATKPGECDWCGRIYATGELVAVTGDGDHVCSGCRP